IVIGGLAGYHGGIFDLIVQRIIEVLQSIPSIPLWLALAAIMPITWSPILIYFGITVILGLIHWTGLARA
ncbi:MAG: ABC transporter permease subunit, partial [Mesorhizobium sp.]